VPIDDSYVTNAGLAVTETTLNVFNFTIYDGNLVPQNSCTVCAPRFGRYNSGSYNNQISRGRSLIHGGNRPIEIPALEAVKELLSSSQQRFKSCGGKRCNGAPLCDLGPVIEIIRFLGTDTVRNVQTRCSQVSQMHIGILCFNTYKRLATTPSQIVWHRENARSFAYLGSWIRIRY
jgi:hypothetical protein